MAKSVGQSHSRRVFKLCTEGLNHQHSVCKCKSETSQKNWYLCYPHFSRSKDLWIHKVMNSQFFLLRHPLYSAGKSLYYGGKLQLWCILSTKLPPSQGMAPHLPEHDRQVFIPAEEHWSTCRQVHQKSAMKALLSQPALSRRVGPGHKALASLGEVWEAYHCRGILWPWWEGASGWG